MVLVLLRCKWFVNIQIYRYNVRLVLRLGVAHFTHLELPMRRLEKLLSLVSRTTSSQNKLIDHYLVPEFVHVYRHFCG